MRTIAFGGILFLGMAAAGFATPVGLLTTNGCAGNQVIVTATAVDFQPTGGGTGCIVTGGSTNVVYAGGVLGGNVTGVIKDLPAGPLPNLDFMTFAGHPLLHFDLSGIGPGSNNFNCAGLANTESCSVAAGSPFVLTLLNGQSVVSLFAFGIARDGVLPNSTWSGSFSVSISTLTPAQIQTEILAGRPVTSTHSGDFNVLAGSLVPEPSTWMTMGAGLLLLVGGGIKRRSIS